jgi:hypothetical protein
LEIRCTEKRKFAAFKKLLTYSFLNIVDLEISSLIDLRAENTGTYVEEKACLLIISEKAQRR